MTTINNALDLLPKGLINSIPRLYAQDGLGRQAIVHAHLFGPVGDFYITEVDEEGETAFGFIKLSAHPDGAELGYINIEELRGIVQTFIETKNIKYLLERDLHWTPVTLAEVMG